MNLVIKCDDEQSNIVGHSIVNRPIKLSNALLKFSYQISRITIFEIIIRRIKQRLSSLFDLQIFRQMDEDRDLKKLDKLFLNRNSDLSIGRKSFSRRLFYSSSSNNRLNVESSEKSIENGMSNLSNCDKTQKRRPELTISSLHELPGFLSIFTKDEGFLQKTLKIDNPSICRNRRQRSILQKVRNSISEITKCGPINRILETFEISIWSYKHSLVTS